MMSNASMKPTVLTCEHLTKDYQVGPDKLRVLDQLQLTLTKGEWIAIVGASGSGKTTLLNMLGGLDRPTEGKVTWMGQDVSNKSESEIGKLRNQNIGFVYQFHHLLPEFTAEENIAMPLWIHGTKKSQAKAVALKLLNNVGLGSRCRHKPAELSGGERQRVAIARALAVEPAIVLMDEPTGNLDHHTAENIQSLLRDLNGTLKTAFITVTHNLEFAGHAQKVYKLEDGQLVLKNPALNKQAKGLVER